MKKSIILFFIFNCIAFSNDILTLEEALKIAVNNNLKLKMAKDRTEQAYYQKEVSSSYFLPRISTSFNYTYLGDNQSISFSPLIPPMKLTDDNLYNLTFTITQPLFTGGKIIRGYEVSRGLYEKAEMDYITEKQNLILEVRKAFLNILKAKNLVEVSRNYRDLVERHLKEVKEMFEEGIATKLDILKVELALKEAETGIIQSENYLQIAKAHLNFLLNRASDYAFDVEDRTGSVDIETIKTYDWWKETSLKERKEIKAMEKIIYVYEKKIQIEKAEMFPQISLFFNYDIEKGTQTSREDWEDSWNTGIVLSYDIWNWGETRNKVRKAEKEKEEMERQFELLKAAVALEVKNGYLNLTSAEKKVKQLEKQKEVAEENVRVAEILYREGMATTTDMLDAITSFTQAKNDYYNALYEWQVAYSELERAAGTWGD